MLELLDQLANPERPANPASKEYQELPEFQADPHLPALSQAFLPASLALLDLPDHPDTLESQVMLDLPDPQAKMVPLAKMVNQAPLDPLDLLELLDLTALLVTKAKMELKKQLYLESPAKLALMELLDLKEPLDPTAPLELLVNPVLKAPLDPQAHLVLMDQLAKMVPLVLPDLLERRVSAPSIVHSMAAFSSKTVPDYKRIICDEGLLQLDLFRSVPMCLLLLLCRSQTRVRRT